MTSLPKLIALLGQDNSRILSGCCEVIEAMGPSASVAFPALIAVKFSADTHISAFCCWFRAIGAMGPSASAAVPALLAIKFPADTHISAFYIWCGAIGAIGPAAASAKSVLMRYLKGEQTWFGERVGEIEPLVRSLVQIGAVEEVIGLMEQVICNKKDRGKISYTGDVGSAFNTLVLIGRPALPTLRRMTTFWQGVTNPKWRVELAKNAIASIERP